MNRSRVLLSLWSVVCILFLSVATILWFPQEMQQVVSATSSGTVITLKNQTTTTITNKKYDSILKAQNSSFYKQMKLNQQEAAITNVHPTVQRPTFEDSATANNSMIHKFLQSHNVNPTDADWIEEYILWHHHQRQNFPDTELLTSRRKDAPRVLISYYDLGSEGLSGRFN